MVRTDSVCDGENYKAHFIRRVTKHFRTPLTPIMAVGNRCAACYQELPTDQSESTQGKIKPPFNIYKL